MPSEVDRQLHAGPASHHERRRSRWRGDERDDRAPPGLPSLPVLFALYIAEIHQAAESQVEDCRGISFVDDIAWIVEGYDIDDVANKLEHCARASLSWAQSNAVRFETSKTEAILFSRKRKH